MNKKITLLALAAVSAAVLALPAMASAEDIPLHLNPTPTGKQTIHGGVATLTTPGSTITCKSVGGTLEFESGGTTGTMDLTFKECTTFGGFVSCRSTAPEDGAGNIQTTTLPFHLLTLPGEEPGVLVTPDPSPTPASFAHINCGGVLFTVEGEGVIGTIEQECGTTADEVGIDFRGIGNTQEHETVEGTATDYDLKKGSETAVQTATGTVTLTEEAELECT